METQNNSGNQNSKSPIRETKIQIHILHYLCNKYTHALTRSVSLVRAAWRSTFDTWARLAPDPLVALPSRTDSSSRYASIKAVSSPSVQLADLGLLDCEEKTVDGCIPEELSSIWDAAILDSVVCSHMTFPW